MPLFSVLVKTPTIITTVTIFTLLVVALVIKIVMLVLAATDVILLPFLMVLFMMSSSVLRNQFAVNKPVGVRIIYGMHHISGR